LALAPHKLATLGDGLLLALSILIAWVIAPFLLVWFPWTPRHFGVGGLLIALAVLTCSVSLGLAVARRYVAQQARNLEVGPDGVRFSWGRGMVTLEYARLDGAEILELGTASFESGGRLYTLQLEAASAQAALMRVCSELSRLPGGRDRLFRIARRAAAGSKLRARPGWISTALALIITAVYVCQTGSRAHIDPLRLIQLGANAGALVMGGEPFRLLAANFLHAGSWHFGITLWGVCFGAFIERHLGETRFLVIYLAAGCAGSIVSAVGSQAMLSVGATSSVFGLLAALAVIQLRTRAVELPVRCYPPPARWLLFVGLFGTLLVIPGVDPLGLLGGAAAGAILAALLRIPRVDEAELSAPLGLRAVAAALVALHVSALVAAWVTPRDEHVFRARALETLCAGGAVDFRARMTMNLFARAVALDSTASDGELDLAERAAQAAAAVAKPEAEVLDTLERIEERLGHYPGPFCAADPRAPDAGASLSAGQQLLLQAQPREGDDRRIAQVRR
jgi:rhomboid protease GluP